MARAQVRRRGDHLVTMPSATITRLPEMPVRPHFLDDLTSLADEVVDEGLIEKALHRMGRPRLRMEELDGRRFLMSTRKPAAPVRALHAAARDAPALFELSTAQLRNSDARVPDGEDDFFADRAVEAWSWVRWRAVNPRFVCLRARAGP